MRLRTPLPPIHGSPWVTAAFFAHEYGGLGFSCFWSPTSVGSLEFGGQGSMYSGEILFMDLCHRRNLIAGFGYNLKSMVAEKANVQCMYHVSCGFMRRDGRWQRSSLLLLLHLFWTVKGSDLQTLSSFRAKHSGLPSEAKIRWSSDHWKQM